LVIVPASVRQFTIIFDLLPRGHSTTYNTVLKAAGLAMTVDDFRRIALSFEGAEESSHMGAADFRVGGRIFATLASAKQGYGNLMLTPGQQTAFVEELPEVFLPVHGGWGRMGATHIRLSAASEDVLSGALQAAWKLRLEKNAKSRPNRGVPLNEPLPPARSGRKAAGKGTRKTSVNADRKKR
jgi:hypothetical protein